MSSVLHMTKTPFTHLFNPLLAQRQSTLMRLCHFTLILHAAIVENASLPPFKKIFHTVEKYTPLRVIPCPDSSCEKAPNEPMSLSRISASLIWHSCWCHNKTR